ncbi:MAG: DUF3137 domain-containing protein [Ignavibacteriales bacterium]|nr:DUF3137 domain-containing protein [Ignavibacteriales bacterium]
MSIRRKLFGPNQDEIWKQLCNEIGATFVEGGFWKGGKVQAQVKEWVVTLDTYTVHANNANITYTRIRAPYVNKDGFRFTVYRKSIFSGIGKFFGMQDVEVGYPEFDEAFIIKGTDESKLRSLFMNSKIREMIQAQPTIQLEVKDDEGWFKTKFPEGVDELYFQVRGVIQDVQRLKALYELFAEVLNHLCHIGSAYENDPKVTL